LLNSAPAPASLRATENEMTVSGNTVSNPWTSSRWAVALACLLAVFGASAASGARADEPGATEDPEPEVSDRARLWGRLLALELQGHIDGPLGVGGGMLVISPLEALAFEVGGGVSRDGGRVAGGLRILLPQDHFALQLRIGIDAGPLSWDSRGQSDSNTSYTVRRRWEFGAGMYADVGLQYRFDFGLYLGLVAGVDQELTNAADRCDVIEGGDGAPTTCAAGGFRPSRIYLGLQVGYAFDIRM
jgi:hypothetical protein